MFCQVTLPFSYVLQLVTLPFVTQLFVILRY